MISESLLVTIPTIKHQQKQSPSLYNDINNELECLIQHLDIMQKYVRPISDDEACISLPPKIRDIKSTLAAEV